MKHNNNNNVSRHICIQETCDFFDGQPDLYYFTSSLAFVHVFKLYFLALYTWDKNLKNINNNSNNNNNDADDDDDDVMVS